MLEDLRGRLLARLLIGPAPRAAARQAREDEHDHEERDLERHARELPGEIPTCQLDAVGERSLRAGLRHSLSA